ncbi:MAG: hydantoinase B/oxoprolinase family protein [Gammaproteobacteria bacterium]
MSNPRVDPVRLALVQSQLDHIARMMGRVMERTARSPIFSESHDFSCFLTDASGDLLSVADGIPIHTGGGGFAVRKLLELAGADMEPGDVFLSNDPYEAGGNHLPDWTVMRPVFRDAALVAFTCNRAHQSDIGGGAAGTYNPAATEIFHEGIRLPPLRIISRGREHADLWHLLRLNSRTPELLDGDLRAMVGSTAIGERELLRIFADIGIDAALASFADVMDYAEARMGAALAGIPDGEYVAEDVSFSDCFEDREVRVAVRVRKDATGLTFDFEGTSPQIRGFKNSSLANTVAACAMATLAFLKPDVPRNEGTLRLLTVKAPLGSLVNARAPAPMTMNTAHCAFEIINAVWKALAQARPEWAIGGWGKTVHCISSGLQPGTAARFILYHWHAYGAAGATAERDGFHTIGGVNTLGGLVLPNVETYERLYPIHVEQYEIRTDAAGAGACRGGAGIQYRARMLTEADYSFRGEGLGTPSGFGVNGGGAGAAGSLTIETYEAAATSGSTPSSAPTSVDVPRYGLRHLPPLAIEILSPGGGGWGDPFRRPPERVLADVRDGTVSRAAARALYGVAVNEDLRSIDAAATSRLRADKR